MLRVIAHDFIREDAVETVLPLYRELVAATRLEPACISYDLLRDREDPTHFIFLEEWPDQAALDAHCASEHFRRIVPQVDAFTRKPAEFTFMEEIVA